MVATSTEHESASALFGVIDTLDFSMIRAKLMDTDEGEGWSGSMCDRVETEYRRYLALCRFYSTRSLVPSQLVDTFWHHHILDTQAYAPDCESVFGYFFHHFPYFGMRGAEDARDLNDAYVNTLGVYSEHFGPAPEEIWPRTGMARCPKCGRA
jgi:hypothetical protein